MRKGLLLLIVGGGIAVFYGLFNLLASVPFLDLLVWVFVGGVLFFLIGLSVAIFKNSKEASH